MRMIRIAIAIDRTFMYVCLCNAITDHEIRQAAVQGVSDLEGLKTGLGVATCCGACESCACEILRDELGNSVAADSAYA
jgi:bacterioferritin-associated ferredoxin